MMRFYQETVLQGKAPRKPAGLVPANAAFALDGKLCDPRRIEAGENPLKMDSKEPSIPYRDFASTETRMPM